MIKIRLFTLLIVHSIAITSCITGCNSKPDSNTPDFKGVSKNNEKVLSGEGFSSTLYTINEPVLSYWFLKHGDYISFVGGRAILNEDTVTYGYKLYQFSTDGKIQSSVELDTSGLGSNGFCQVGDNRIACSTRGGGFILFDYEGKKIKETKGDLSSDSTIYDAESAGSGFVIISSDKLAKYDYDGNKIVELNTDGLGFISEDVPYFERPEGSYLSREADVGRTLFYKLDIESRTIEPADGNGKLNFEDDSTIYRYGGYSYDENNGVVKKIDFESGEIVPIAETAYFLYQPPRYRCSTNVHFHILDDDHFATVYRYDIGLCDIVILSPDDSLNGRKILNIRGNRINEDMSILQAVYKYNTSQDVFFLKASSLGDDYSYTSANEAQQARLDLIKKIEQGLGPDIFYGNDLDYDYFGRTGIVIDMKPYLDDEFFDKMMEPLKNLMIKEGHTYQVFTGFTLMGLVGDKHLYKDNSYKISELPELADYNRRFCDTSAVNLADYIIRYYISNNGNHNINLNKDNLKYAVHLALINGVTEYGTSNSDPGDISGILNGDYSLYLKYINNDIRQFRNEDQQLVEGISFIGFPSFEGSNHVIYPQGLVAISQGTNYPEECSKFVSILMSDDIQNMNYSTGAIPVNELILEKYLSYMEDPKSIPEDDKVFRCMVDEKVATVDTTGHLVIQSGSEGIPVDIIKRYKDTVYSADTLLTIDWGIFSIINEEISSYYTLGKTEDAITDALLSRLTLYVEENYG